MRSIRNPGEAAPGDKKGPLSPWQKIIRAAEKGRGLRLTAEEIYRLSCDEAIETKASNDDYPEYELDDPMGGLPGDRRPAISIQPPRRSYQ